MEGRVYIYSLRHKIRPLQFNSLVCMLNSTCLSFKCSSSTYRSSTYPPTTHHPSPPLQPQPSSIPPPPTPSVDTVSQPSLSSQSHSKVKQFPTFGVLDQQPFLTSQGHVLFFTYYANGYDYSLVYFLIVPCTARAWAIS